RLAFLNIHYLFVIFSLFFFNDPATTEIYTLSLHDALPICEERGTADVAAGTSTPAGAPVRHPARDFPPPPAGPDPAPGHRRGAGDRKSTRLNSSHDQISYAVFCLKKKNKK